MRLGGLYDVIVIGGGPAGLAAGAACENQGLSVRLFEAGTLLDSRNHEVTHELALGVGGAGLFSDGKFSFFPSAQRLWELDPREDLETSIDWMRQLLNSQNIDVPSAAFPSEGDPPALISHSFFKQKDYPSIYATLDQRRSLIDELQGRIYSSIHSNTAVTRLDLSRRNEIVCEVSSGAGHQMFRSRCLIICGGRFGPILTQETEGLPSIFRRFEAGVRIEQPSDKFFLNSIQQLDVKLILDSDANEGVEWRTFCCCRNGEIADIKSFGLLALSGRSDVAKGDFSNVGFNVRFTDRLVGAEAWEAFRSAQSDLSSRVSMKLLDFVSTSDPERTPIGALFGAATAQRLAFGLQRLVEEFGVGHFEAAVLHGPTLEGLGEYPHVNQCLRVDNSQIWVAGDASGLFRGLVAALVSGYFSGVQVARYVREAQ